MILLGLTGSIGMGKTTAARMFRDLGLPVHDADATVHALQAPGGEAFSAIAEAFPDVVIDGRIDRGRLGKRAFSDPAVIRTLEAILHPLVRACENRFLQQASRRREPLVVLDIPLLFETGGEHRVDATVVVTAPERVQRHRVLARPGMTAEKLNAVIEKQLSDAEKRRRADFIVQTGIGHAYALRRVREIVTMAETLKAAHWPRFGPR